MTGAEPAAVIGVIGAGTMGSGIAQLGARSGAQTLLHDPIPEALEQGLERAREGLRREAAKGRISAQDAQAAAERLQPMAALEDLAPCELVIEAAPERLELKHEIYTRLAEIVSAECVLATNTSSLLVTAIATAVANPGRVVGMHFFNPAPVMPLLEVVAGEESSEDALALARATGEAMGRTVILASDVAGFIVNRCNRPFGLEALRLLQERIAEVAEIDRIVRMAGGFRMGPFELMDLVGVETGFAVSKSFYEQSFGEPRWRPSPIAARYVAAGRWGRKTGRGYYDYGGPQYREEDPPPLEGAPAEGAVVIAGEGRLAQELREAATAAGYEVREPHAPLGDTLPALFVDCDPRPGEDSPAPGGARMVLCARGSLAALDPQGGAVGFHALPPLDSVKLVELVRVPASSPLAAQRAERFFAALGRHTAWVGDAPGLVLGRIVCQIVNESAFSLGEGVGSAGDIDLGMVLGLSHPRGPFEWADTIGLDHVLEVLEALCSEYREERYRPAPLLRRLVAEGRLGRSSGSGFLEHAQT